jgi:hypothetical protein
MREIASLVRFSNGIELTLIVLVFDESSLKHPLGGIVLTVLLTQFG